MKLNAKNLIREYINSASKIMNRDKILSIDNFEYLVAMDLSKKFNLSEDKFNYLNHVFHWTFFDYDSREISPVELTPYPRLLRNKLKIKLAKPFDSKVKKNLIDYISENYQNLLDAKIARLN